jgi:hypothetical protein
MNEKDIIEEQAIEDENQPLISNKEKEKVLKGKAYKLMEDEKEGKT